MGGCQSMRTAFSSVLLTAANSLLFLQRVTHGPACCAVVALVGAGCGLPSEASDKVEALLLANVADDSGPRLLDFTFQPTAVDTSLAAADVTFVARVTDDLSGVDRGGIAFFSPSGAQRVDAAFSAVNLVAGTEQDGTYEFRARFPRYSESGIWELGDSPLYLFDRSNNVSHYSAADLTAANLATSISVHSATSDLDPPRLRSLMFVPSTVDPTATPTVVTIRARVTDDLAGVNRGGISFASPSGEQRVDAAFSLEQRVSGDDVDGTYEFTMTFPTGSEPGTWELGSNLLYLFDNTENSAHYDVAALDAENFPHSIQVGPPQAASLELTELSFSPSTVDTALAAAQVSVRARVVDTVAGFNRGGISFASPSGNQGVDAAFSAFDRISGTANDGVYAFVVTLPRHCEAGLWELGSNQLYLFDANEVVRHYESTDLSARGFPSAISVSDSNSDLAPPQLRELSFQPAVLDTRVSAGQVLVRARVTDNLAGVDRGGLSFMSPSGTARVDGAFSSLDRVSGSALDGVYEFRVTFPIASEVGFWQLGGNDFYLYDSTSNLIHYDAAALAAAGLPASIRIGVSEAPPALSVEDAVVVEGNRQDKRTLSFTVRLTPASTETVSVSFTTIDGSAASQRDFKKRSGKLRFNRGVTSAQIDVDVVGDVEPEPSETLKLALTEPKGAGLSRDVATGTIHDDD